MSTPTNRGLIFPFLVVILTLTAGGIGGVGVALTVMAVGFVAVVAFHTVHCVRLQRWATNSMEHFAPLPEGMGVWADVFAALSRREHKRVAFQMVQKQTIEQFRKMAEALPDGVIVLDAQYHIEWANVHAQHWLALDLDKDRRRPIGNLVRYPEFLQFLDNEAGGELSGESDRSRQTLLIHTIFDTGKTLALQQVPFGHGGRLLLIHDVTEYETTARMRRELIASVSHELKTPLTVIIGFLETMRETSSAPETQDRYLDLMQQQARSMQRLVDDLLMLSSLESGDRIKEEEAFDAKFFLQQLFQETQALSQGRHTITLTLPEVAVKIHGVRDELASVMTNLLSNAVRYTPEGGTIALTETIDVEGRGVFTVRDSGIGIAAEHLPRLTERFYRVDRGRSRASGGTGLGLAIVKHVLLHHQGELTMDSRIGEGSTFTVTLPKVRIQAPV